MKSYFALIGLLICSLRLFAQRSALDIPQLHQLIAYSKSEHNLQTDARDQQAVTSANEAANKSLLEKFKNSYRTLQQRFNSLGLLINAADIGIQASPMLQRIIRDQSRLYADVRQHPLIIPLCYAAEAELVSKAQALFAYVTGLSLSIGDVNQMKASDRKLLFDYVIAELSAIQDLSARLLDQVRYFKLWQSVSPFADYANTDAALVNQIMQNAKYLKR